MPSSPLDYRELVPIQEAAGGKGERQIYNLESVVGCLGRKLASSNSRESWHRGSFCYSPRIVVDALLARNSAVNNSNSNNSERILSSALCQALSRCITHVFSDFIYKPTVCGHISSYRGRPWGSGQ